MLHDQRRLLYVVMCLPSPSVRDVAVTFSVGGSNVLLYRDDLKTLRLGLPLCFTAGPSKSEIHPKFKNAVSTLCSSIILHLLRERDCVIVSDVYNYVIIRTQFRYSFAGGKFKHTQDVLSVRLSTRHGM
jgi:hypothetical protein